MRPDGAWPSDRLLNDRLAARSSFPDSDDDGATGAVVAMTCELDTRARLVCAYMVELPECKHDLPIEEYQCRRRKTNI
jgi:hypothetical protein